MTAAARQVTLAYGRSGLRLDVPPTATVVTPRPVRPAPDPAAELRRALRDPVQGPPLRNRVRTGQTVAISICDVTRPQPRPLMVQAVLDELDGIVRDDDVTVLVATGTHRRTTDSELTAMLGPELLARVRVVDHDGRDEDQLRWMGIVGQDVPVWLNRHWVDADIRVTTGFVEPHFFAGFSGGPKMVAPGLAGLETVLTLHDARRIGSDRASWGVCEGNPVHDDIRAIAAATGVDFALDVVLDRDQRIVAAFGGPVLAMHAVAREVARTTAMAPVPAPFDVVVTTNSGYPLDQNLYQAVKGISAAAAIVKPGGTIVAAAQCSDGFPDHGGFRSVLASAPTAAALAADIASRTVTVPDQWQAQVLTRVLARARVLLHCDTLDAGDLAGAHLGHAPDLAEAVDRALAAAGPDGSLCVLPEGPQTIAYHSPGQGVA